MNKIKVTKRGSDYHACIEGKPSIWSAGKTQQEAIGDLVMTHSEIFGTQVLPESEKTEPDIKTIVEGLDEISRDAWSGEKTRMNSIGRTADKLLTLLGAPALWAGEELESEAHCRGRRDYCFGRRSLQNPFGVGTQEFKDWDLGYKHQENLTRASDKDSLTPRNL